MDLSVYFSGDRSQGLPWLVKTSLTGFSHISVCIFYVKMPTFTRETKGNGEWDVILLVLLVSWFLLKMTGNKYDPGQILSWN